LGRIDSQKVLGGRELGQIHSEMDSCVSPFFRPEGGPHGDKEGGGEEGKGKRTGGRDNPLGRDQTDYHGRRVTFFAYEIFNQTDHEAERKEISVEEERALEPERAFL